MAHRTIINLQTGEIKQVALTQQEIDLDQQKELVNEQQRISKEQQEANKQSALTKLSALGLTEAEIKAIIG